MQVTTARRFAPMPSNKEWAWSYSRLKNYEDCPSRYNHLDVLKDVKEEESEHLAYGHRVHKAAAGRLGPLHQPLSAEYAFLDPWCTQIEMAAQGGKLLVEQQLAVTKQMKPTGWFSSDVWLRVVADVVTLKPPLAISIDWKTGKIIEDSVQLMLVGTVLFAHYPDIEKVTSQYIWLKEGCDTTVDMTRYDLKSMWSGVLPRVEALELASITDNYPPKPGGLCKRFCPVASCKYHGVGSH